ncbi:MAG: hypothetical protein A2010_03070 [Nitrospirae bacterium GWD2_57_9]|nr:MAG: hypothetical protein A2010_03070 [Nitrospirae bacterium GWD2_57_9]
MFVTRFVVCVLAAALLAGCQPQPNKQHADRNKFYQDVKTASVVVQEKYGVHTGIALPFRNYVEAWLRIANVAVVDEGAAASDCIIRIAAEGEPLKARYGSSGSLFTGARLSGTLQIERPSLHKDEVRFSEVVDPPRTFASSGTIDYARPENAPFVQALIAGEGSKTAGAGKTVFDGFKLRLAVLMGRYFGRSVLLIALDDYNSNGILRDSAVDALAAQGKPAIPFLIDAFRFCSPTAEKGVGEALEKITGQKFGSDAKRWNEWLGRQGQKQ